ncbi:hypothetical protein Tco_0366427 [Tanacetum coccineum]
MEQLEFCDKHNMVAYLVKSESSECFDEIIDFLTSSHIYYALTENPIIFVSLIEQFWETAVLSTTEEGLQAISATIDGHEKLITEDSLRRHLKLDDAEGISSLSNEEIFEHLAHMGYVTNSESLTFFKGHFSPQWKFFIHTILHCLSSKKTAWDQFSSNIATALICLATSRKFNFSKFIFEAMVKNLDSPHKFLLYPRFIQLLLNKQKRLLLPHTRTYPTPILTSKLFSNMRRASKGYSGVVTPLFENMLVQAQDEEQQSGEKGEMEISTANIQVSTASPPKVSIVAPHVYTRRSAKDKRKAIMEEPATPKKVKKRTQVRLGMDEELALVQDEGISWIPQEEEVHEKPSDETEILVQEETLTEIIEEHGSGDKGEMKISTANIQVSTASPLKVSTTVPHVYTRRSAKDKRKAIMEDHATPKKVKKRTQVQLSMDEELARKMEEEERIRFNAEQEARALQEEEEERLNLEAARELQRQLDQRQEIKQQDIDNILEESRRLQVEEVWDHVNTFIPIGSEVEKDSSKPSERETLKTVEEEKVEEDDVNPEPMLIEKKAVGIRRKTLARRREVNKLRSRTVSKRQKKRERNSCYEDEKLIKECG